MRTTILTLLLGFSISILTAQSTLSGTEIIDKRNFSELSSLITEYKIYRIDVIKEKINISSSTPYLDLELGDNAYALNLFQENLKVSYGDKYSEHPLLLGGSMRTGGTVSLTINDGFIYGFMRHGATQTFIEPLSYLIKGADKDLFVVYNTNAVVEDREHVCGVTESMMKGNNLAPSKSITACAVIDMGIANTFDMITKYGSNTATENHNLAVLNNVQTNYRSEFDENYEFNVVSHYLPSSAANDPLSPATTTNDALTLLGNFQTWAEDPGSCPGSPCFNNCGGGDCGGANGGFGVDHTIGSLWTDRDITFGGSSGTVGLAYTPGWYNLLEDYTTSAASLSVMVTHEIGHNFSANHDASGSNFIMAPSVTLTNDWSSVSKADISGRLNAQSYLSACSTLGAPTANFFKSATAVCTGSPIEFEDQSQYGATRSWEFTGGTPATSTDEKPTVTYNTAGLYAVKLTSTNSAGSDIYFDFVDIEVAPATPCTPSGGTGGSGGITLVNIENLSFASTTTGLYDDNACDQVASLEPSTSYSLTVGVSGVTRLRYFIDYNNDGDFLDTDEGSGTFSFSGNGNLAVGLNTPGSPVLETLLRMRVTVSTGTIDANGCTAPSTGQVEDYSVYFPVTQILGCTDPTASNYNANATVDDGSCNTGGSTWYADTDNDGFGDINNTTTATSQPSGFVADSTDCDDNDANNFPGNTEVCDGQDNDCNGQIDEGVLTTFYLDNDNDNFGDDANSTQACSAPSGYVADNTDCDDNDANNFPGNTEVCDGQDNNCDGIIDEGVMSTFYLDNDNDNFGDSNNSTQACSAPSGYVANDTDCDDNDNNNYPGNTEICDGQDNNCNGLVDEGTSSTSYYADSDADGYGDPLVSLVQCTQPSGYVTNDSDCDDSDASINPNAIEICDGLDNNCDGVTDESCNTCDGAYLVINVITQNTYRAAVTVVLSATINGSNELLFTAGAEIELLPGFEVILGADFEARIEPCISSTPSPSTQNNAIEGYVNTVQKSFEKEEEVNATIISIDNIVQAGGLMKTKDLNVFLKENLFKLNKGSYKLILNNLDKEIEQDILVIK